MKSFIYIVLFCCFLSMSYAQDTITVNGEALSVTTEVDGELDLLWTITDGTYRYFARTIDNTVYELSNTKNNEGNYTEEYKTLLAELMNSQFSSFDAVKLTLPNLKSLFDRFNALENPDYVVTSTDRKIYFRLGVFGGITNHPFVENIGNSSYPQLAAELEVFSATTNPRHAGIFQIRQTVGGGGDYSTTELSIGYRFRVIRKETFNLFVQNKFGSLNFASSHIRNSDNMMTFNAESDTLFDVPFAFGIGADIKISKNSFISIVYDSLFGLNVDDSGNFSTDILVGYKFNL